MGRDAPSLTSTKTLAVLVCRSCETSFWSFLNGRPTPLAHIALKQAATLRWWQEIAPKCEVYDEESE